MERAGADALDQLIEKILRAIRDLEQEVTSLTDDASTIHADFAEERASVQQEREDRDIFYSLETGTPYLVAAPDTVELRERERVLTEASLRAGALERKLNDFGTVLSVTKRQFEVDGDEPGVDSTSDVAVRIARIQAQEDERRRFARDIHDGPAQAFANAIIGLEFVERAIKVGAGEAQALSEIERIKGSLREGLTEIRRFMFDLKPTMLLERGLIATLEHYVTTYQSILPMTVTLNISDDLPPMSSEQEMTAFRVIQESLHNATKYSRATRVEIALTPDSGEGIEVRVQDNGKGFDPDQVTAGAMGGTGITGMRERADLIGASLKVKSAPGEGCTVALQVPNATASDHERKQM